ncbi:MAG: hypothetical protein QM805_20990 [Pseudomonas sp.]
MRRTIAGFAMATLCLASSLQAQECDCTVPKGQCNAYITVTPTGTGKGLYGADLAIRTNASQCAKVEYRVDNTPYFTVLPQGQGDDRIQGTAMEPLSNERVVMTQCVVCAVQAQAMKQAPPDSKAEQIFGDALDSGNNFDPTAMDQRLDEIKASDHMPSAATLIGVAAAAQQVQAAAQAQAAHAAEVQAAASAARAASVAGGNQSSAAPASGSSSQKSSGGQSCWDAHPNETWRCGVR